MTVRILHGDCRQVLKTLPDDSVHCCVTSPPYWGLRSYLPADHPDKHLEIGSEPTLQEWVQTMVEVLREVRRVLRPDGTLWLNLGDAYAGSGRGGSGWPGSTLNGAQPDHSRAVRHQAFTADHKNASAAAGRSPAGAAGKHAYAVDAGQLGRVWVPPPKGFKPKDLMGQPWRVAFALQEDGWWLRQEIIWSKPNPMPESTRDRCTKAHEHVFLLSKSERYFYDFDAMQEPVNGNAHARRPMEYSGAKRPGFGHGYDAEPKPRYKTPDGWETSRGQGGHGSFHPEGRGKGHVPNVGRREGPPGNPAEGKTIERPIARASRNMGRQPGWRGEVKNNDSMAESLADLRDTRNPRSVWTCDDDEYQQFLAWKAEQAIAADVWTIPTHPFKGAHFATFPPALAERCITAGCPPGGTVLDPFGGSGTVGLVADRQHKSAVLIDLDARNVPMATSRIASDAPLFAEVSAA